MSSRQVLRMGLLVAALWGAAVPAEAKSRCRSEEIYQEVDAAAARLGARVGLPASVLRLALTAFFRARCLGDIRRDVLSVIDFTQPSSAPRLWVLDVARASVLFRARVAHGRGSGEMSATQFSDQPESRATSLGLFVTGSTYYGKHGYSLRLDGLETGVNAHARERGIVVHPAGYMTDGFVNAHGRAGRSFGCPALDPALSRPIIDAIKDGSALWAYYPNQRWLNSSSFLVLR